MTKKFWINAGELSGDMQGGRLLEAMRAILPDAQYMGMGGDYLAAAGLDTRFRIEDLSVMGVTEVIGHLPKIFSLLKRIKAALAQERPDALIVIDAPEFNFRVIKAAHELGIPVYYYISPKIWAWRQGRAEFIKQHVRRVVSILPFEVEFYQRFGMDIDYVGNPLIDIVDRASLPDDAREQGLVGFLPGSRVKEVTSLMPEFGAAARILRQRVPHLRFACVCAPNLEAAFLRSLWPDDVPVEFVSPDNRYAFMRSCELLIAASGTVTLESAIVGTPTIVTYKVSPLSFAVGKMLVKVPYCSLPNLILGRELFPELLQERCNAVPLADAALAWLLPVPGTNPLAVIERGMAEVRATLGDPGAAERAAKVILNDFQ